MSKVDAMRALREARWSAATKAGVRLTPTAGRPAAEQPVAPRPARAAARPATVAESPTAEALCGHRNMAGRSCTRAPDHVKDGTRNHRYG